MHRFETGVRHVLDQNPNEYKRKIIQASIAILAARILRDRLREKWPISSGVNDFLEYARAFLPGYFNIPVGIAQKLDSLLINYLNDTLDFSQVSIDIVGKFYESAFVTKEVRDQWGIHYTPSLLAKTLLKRMPIEEIPPEKRILADPTCGSGSLLAAGYERLTDASYRSLSDTDRHQKLINSLFGNDKDPFAVEIARMTLMLFHPPHKNNWIINKLDAEDNDFTKKWKKQMGVQPSIIVANPPFGEKGGGTQHPGVQRARNQSDRSALILKQCLNILPNGGLLGIILTETILDQQLVKSLRNNILKSYQILEQWSIPVGWFQNVKRPAMAWIIRKSPPLLKTVNILSLADIPVIGRRVPIQEIMTIDSQNLPENLVPSPHRKILQKIAKNSICIKDSYFVHNGLQPIRKSVNEKTLKAHPWSGVNIRGTDPFSSFSDGHEGWLELKDNNFPVRSQRRALRKILGQNKPMLMLRANRNAPWKYKWSSVAMIDVPKKNSKVVAPSESFHVAFSKENDIKNENIYIYALWAVMNHPIASLWFHETARVQKIPTKSFRKFPLPKDWTSKEKIALLASYAKDLINNIMASKNEIFESPKGADIEELVKKLDDFIFEMYEITAVEKRQIAEWFGKEARPGFNDRDKMNKRDTIPDFVENIGFGESIWETTFETLEIDVDKDLIKLAIDGLSCNCKEDLSNQNELWIRIISAIPGWVIKQGSMGWIELTTHDASKLNKFPEKHIASFRLHKNAYKTQDEIDTSLHLISEIKNGKAIS